MKAPIKSHRQKRASGHENEKQHLLSTTEGVKSAAAVL
jgi:hypothetical protein